MSSDTHFFRHLRRAGLLLTTAGAIGAASLPAMAADTFAYRFDGLGFSKATISGYFQGQDLDHNGFIFDYFEFQSGLNGGLVLTRPFQNAGYPPEISRAMLSVQGQKVDHFVDTANPATGYLGGRLVINYEIATGKFTLDTAKMPSYLGLDGDVMIRPLPDGRPFLRTGCLAGERGCYVNFEETGTGFALTAVPEPGTWALAIAGLGVAGLARARRSRG